MARIGKTLVEAGHIKKSSFTTRSHRAFDTYCQKILTEAFNQHCFDLAKVWA